MKILTPYKPLFEDDNHQVILKSGRDAGKSTAIYQLIVRNLFKYDLDIIVARSNYGDLERSIFSGIVKYLEDEGLIDFVTTRTRPLKIINNIQGNTIYFQGIGGADLSRTKGLEPSKKVSLFVVDECQQVPRKENLDQAFATFRRHFHNKHWKYVLAFNPEKSNAHWLNEEYRALEQVDDWLAIHTDYRKIAKMLTDIDLKAIRLEKRLNPDNYKYLYLGETDGLFGGVYYTFNPAFHTIKEKKAKEMIKSLGIYTVIIGVDAATTRDKTAFIPTIILNNGQGIVIDYFYHDPERFGAMSNDQLYPYVAEWLDFILLKWQIPTTIPINMVFDPANADLRLLMSHKLPQRYAVFAYNNKKIVQMANIMQNIFSRNALYIVDSGNIFNWITKQPLYEHPLIQQLTSVIWDESGVKFDPKIPNDATDALTYSTAFYYKNPNALYFPKMQDYYERSE